MAEQQQDLFLDGLAPRVKVLPVVYFAILDHYLRRNDVNVRDELPCAQFLRSQLGRKGLGCTLRLLSSCLANHK